MRAWHGPALLTYGFRPFFLLGAVWAAVAMGLWILMLAGVFSPATRMDLVSWHAHAFLFGYLGAIIAGFLLTAVPNWTGRLPVVGWQLGGLVLLWLAGRLAILVSQHLPMGLAAGIDLAFPIVLGAVILREILAGKTWGNLVVLALLAIFTLANVLFHLDVANGDIAAKGIGLRLGLAAVIGMIALIGGRILPSFTRNWLVKRGTKSLPAPPMQRFDKVTLLISAAILLLWVLTPDSWITGLAMIMFAILHTGRLVRWRGYLTGAEPLVWILHFAYAMLPLGAVLISLSNLRPDLVDPAAAQHLWMAGALGLMTLAVMTRATLGHTGQTLHAGNGTVAIYSALIGSMVVRLFAGNFPGNLGYEISAALWIAAFMGFAVVYGRLLARRKATVA
ncbi:NnrS family protein [Pseudosulfitobacter koreensis]|uniref:NnrS family protein n=1 Tax=Pseudosulfitobacter koreensis TaxID=2968472 RepID=A0ABT1Z4Y9_9RHOB|nr:NnrS family protein [Pseudosulfitobacter koreense]MCR8828202.1 NnrS family protein [Pseudosulfitobacter koreense]